MLPITIAFMLAFVVTWIVFASVAYTILYTSLILSYLFVWDDQTRQQICPHGLLHALLYDR